jgi:flagellar biosynthetic protein FliO
MAHLFQSKFYSKIFSVFFVILSLGLASLTFSQTDSLSDISQLDSIPKVAQVDSTPQEIQDSVALDKILKVATINKNINSNTQTVVETKSFASLLLQVVLGLIVVLIMMIATLYVLKKIQGGKFSQSAGGGVQFKMNGVYYVGPKQKVVVLTVHDRTLVLGVTDSSVSPITELVGNIPEGEAINPSTALVKTVDQMLAKFKRAK